MGLEEFLGSLHWRNNFLIAQCYCTSVKIFLTSDSGSTSELCCSLNHLLEYAPCLSNIYIYIFSCGCNSIASWGVYWYVAKYTTLVATLICPHTIEILKMCGLVHKTYSWAMPLIGLGFWVAWSHIYLQELVDSMIYRSVPQNAPPFAILALVQNTVRGMWHFLSRLCPPFRCHIIE